MFKVGDVFIWKNFPYIRDTSSSIKNRYFIYVGKTKVFVTPLCLYITTSTTQTKHYEKGGERYNHNVCRFLKGEAGFEEESIIDVDFNFYSDITHEQIKNCMSDIEIIGKVPVEKLRHLYNLIIKSDKIAKIVKMDIFNSFQLDGITGMKKPK